MTKGPRTYACAIVIFALTFAFAKDSSVVSRRLL
jgi:hypothetical protein